MIKYIGIFLLILIFLSVFVPFASSLPDGLEKIVEAFGVETQLTYWNGFMSNYLIETIKNSTISTLISGAFGAFMVLIAALLLGKTLRIKKTS